MSTGKVNTLEGRLVPEGHMKEPAGRRLLQGKALLMWAVLVKMLDILVTTLSAMSQYATGLEHPGLWEQLAFAGRGQCPRNQPASATCWLAQSPGRVHCPYASVWAGRTRLQPMVPAWGMGLESLKSVARKELAYMPMPIILSLQHGLHCFRADQPGPHQSWMA